MIKSILIFLQSIPLLIDELKQLRESIEKLRIQKVEKEIQSKLDNLNKNITLLKQAKSNDEIKRFLDGISGIE
jgi:hypothetical protein